MLDTPPATRSARRRHGKSWAARLNTAEGLRSRQRQLAVLPTGAGVLLIALAGYRLRSEPVWSGLWWVWAAAAAGCVVVLGVAWRIGDATAVAVHRQRVAAVEAVERQRAADGQAVEQWVTRLRSALADGLKDVQRTLDQLQRGEQAQVRAMPSAPVARHAFALLEHDLHGFVRGVQMSVADASAQQEKAAVLSIARRMLTLLTQMLKAFDGLEREMEDPEVLGPVFRLDHMATRLRRLAESISVVGGAVPRRSSKPTPLSDVINHAIAEVEQYGRVRVASPVEGVVVGRAAAGLIHLLAELIDNAANFSDTKTQVLIRVEKTASGVVIQIDDRGKLMPEETFQRLNSLLSDPSRHHAGEHLRDGRIGMWVVAEYARRLRLQVRLQSNFYLSNQAEVRVPIALFHSSATGQEQGLQPDPRTLVQAPASGLSGEGPASVHTLPGEADRAGNPAGPSAARPAAVGGMGTLPVRSSAAGRPVPGPSTSGAGDDSSPGGAPAPLPVRDTTRSYLAAELQDTTVAHQEPAAPPDPGLVARVIAGQHRAGTQDGGAPGTTPPLGTD